MEIVLLILMCFLILLFAVDLLFRDKWRMKRWEEMQKIQNTSFVAEVTEKEYQLFQSFQAHLAETLRSQRNDLDRRLEALGEQSDRRLSVLGEQTDKKLEMLSGKVEDRLHSIQKNNFEHTQRLNDVMERKISSLQESNEKKLEEMRTLVDKELQRTLSTRLTESFGAVAASLESVQKGLGEMQGLAKDARDLKNVLTNVKNRGDFGEVLLGKLLEDILAPGQFVENVEIRKGKRVEFAVKLPGSGDEPVYLPIDSKFPAESYKRLTEAETKEQMEAARKEIDRAVTEFAKQISEYIEPPRTSNFALMFLPTEGLYAEVVRNTALFEEIRKKYGVIAVGATTLSALLSSLLIGFKTLAIEKRSEEVWGVLAKVKKEFEKFAEALDKAKVQIGQAEKTIDALTTTRMRMMNRALSRVDRYELPETSEDADLPELWE